MKFVWNTVHQQEFDFLKNALISAPILAFPNMQKEFILTTDACTSGIAYILSQLDNQGREHVICCGGRGLRKSELNWSISELECLAIIEGTCCYHQYLVSRPFTIVTDHVSLTFPNSLKAGRSLWTSDRCTIPWHTKNALWIAPADYRIYQNVYCITPPLPVQSYAQVDHRRHLFWLLNPTFSRKNGNTHIHPHGHAPGQKPKNWINRRCL